MRLVAGFAAVLLAALVGQLLALGCSTSNAKWGLDDMEARLHVSGPAAFQAAQAAVVTFGLVVETSIADVDGGTVRATSAQDERVIVRVTGVDDSTSLLSIEVQPFGNEALAKKLHEHILLFLPPPPPVEPNEPDAPNELELGVPSDR